MSPAFQSSVAFVGRILVSIIFLLSGINKIMSWDGTAAYMADHGMTGVPCFLTVAILIEILAGLALMLGWQTRIASLILFLYLIPVTLVMHNFWAYQGQMEQQQMINFLKNLAIMGGLLELCAFGAGAISLDSLSAGMGSRLPFKVWRAAPPSM